MGRALKSQEETQLKLEDSAPWRPRRINSAPGPEPNYKESKPKKSNKVFWRGGDGTPMAAFRGAPREIDTHRWDRGPPVGKEPDRSAALTCGRVPAPAVTAPARARPRLAWAFRASSPGPRSPGLCSLPVPTPARRGLLPIPRSWTFKHRGQNERRLRGQGTEITPNV